MGYSGTIQWRQHYSINRSAILWTMKYRTSYWSRRRIVNSNDPCNFNVRHGRLLFVVVENVCRTFDKTLVSNSRYKLNKLSAWSRLIMSDYEALAWPTRRRSTKYSKLWRNSKHDKGKSKQWYCNRTHNFIKRTKGKRRTSSECGIDRKGFAFAVVRRGEHQFYA